jgi:4'-phosphopantetheinyl transferase
MAEQAAAPSTLPRRVVLPTGEVHVWHATLDPELSPPAAPPTLSVAERSRAKGYRFDRDRRRFLSSRTLLRLLLSAYVDAPPAKLEFDTTCRFCGELHGKPRLVGADPDFDFSLAYAEGAFLLAISAAGPVGADIEAIPPLDSIDDLLLAAATAAEARAMSVMEAEDRRHALARLWTLKEAVLKATGHGLGVDPRELELSGLDSAPRLAGTPREWGTPTRWHLRSIDQGGPYAAALALPRAPVAVETWKLSEPFSKRTITPI